ncbi:tetratricopeptide repeat protein [Granulicella sp. dw_53]|uniref:tetratricopeptide repeat protein n=1 Tax=Granulicella sp. dw_53 TaxID=2719792 RepID=UPI001BD6DFE4
MNGISVRIAQQLQKIEAGERAGLSTAKLGYMWSVLASQYQDAADGARALDAYERALHLLAKDPGSRSNYATSLDNLGALYLEYGRIAEAEKVRKRALEIRTEIGNPIDIAKSEQHMAEVALSQHRYKDAARGSRRALEILSATGAADRRSNITSELSALVSLTYAECMQSKQEDALQHAERAIRLVESAFSLNSLERAHVSMALGAAQWKMGQIAEAEQSMKDGLSIMRERLGENNPMVIAATFEYCDFLQAIHRNAEVAVLRKELSERMSGMTRPLPGYAVSAYALR